MTSSIVSSVVATLEEMFDLNKLSLSQAGCLMWLTHREFKAHFEGRLVSSEVESNYSAISYLGYGSAMLESEAVSDALIRGCNWLVGREIRRTNGEPQQFALDPVALLGIALGADRLEEPCRSLALNHIASCLDLAKTSYSSDSLKMAFALACQQITGAKLDLGSNSSPAVTYALFERLAIDIADELIEPAFVEVQIASQSNVEPFPAGLFLNAYRALLRQTTTLNLSKVSVPDVLKLLANLQAGLMRWPFGQNKTQVWNIENEYDVQSMLFFLLKPYLPELKEEEPLPSVGRKRPRVDLVVPSLGLSIEVKFLRKSGFFNDILGEVAEDKSLYLGPGSRYSRMIVFLWDDSARTEDHASFRQGVTELGIDGAIVVSRPSFMVRGAK